MSEKDIYEKIDKVDTKHDQKHEDTLIRLESYHAHIMEIVTTGAVLSERLKQIKDQMENLPQPESRPCKALENHIQDHKDAQTIWKRPVISCIVDLIKMGIVFAIAFLWGAKK